MKIILLLIIGLGVNSLFAQKIDSSRTVIKKNLIYVNIGVASSINYERILINKKRPILNSLNLQIGGSNTLGLLGGGTVVGADLSLLAVTGVKNNHLILGGGVGFVDYSDEQWFRINMSNYNYAIEKGTEPGEKPVRNKFRPSFRLGYRFQEPNGRFMFNTGISSEEIVFIGAGISL